MTSTLAPAEPRRRVDGRLVVLLVVIALGTRGLLRGSLDPVALRTWTTVFVAIVVQALPFLALGVLVSGAITALVSPAVLQRALPRSALLAVPGAALAGTALPGCECASVPTAGPNLGVYLKGHAGDLLKVDRRGRPPEYVERPCLTIGLAVQPEVLRGLAGRPGFSGRGLLARFLYSPPRVWSAAARSALHRCHRR